jgi:N utilization substance protein A
MTPEQLEEIPGIGEKTLEKISLAVRHYFGEYEPGEERPVVEGAAKSDEELVAQAAAIEDAQSAEEIDALTLDLEGEREVVPDNRDGSGMINDDLAGLRMEELTESGRDVGEFGVTTEVPGRDDTSETITRHSPNYDLARSETVDDGNVEEASQETREDAKVDEGGV